MLPHRPKAIPPKIFLGSVELSDLALGQVRLVDHATMAFRIHGLNAPCNNRVCKASTTFCPRPRLQPASLGPSRSSAFRSTPHKSIAPQGSSEQSSSQACRQSSKSRRLRRNSSYCSTGSEEGSGPGTALHRRLSGIPSSIEPVSLARSPATVPSLADRSGQRGSEGHAPPSAAFLPGPGIAPGIRHPVCPVAGGLREPKRYRRHSRLRCQTNTTCGLRLMLTVFPAGGRSRSFFCGTPIALSEAAC